MFIIIFEKLSSCMNAQPFTKSGAGAVPINMPEDCLYTPRNCANPSSNMKLIYSHGLARPTLSHFLLLVISLVFKRGLKYQCTLLIFGSFSSFLLVAIENIVIVIDL